MSGRALRDGDVARCLARLGLPGVIDVHVRLPPSARAGARGAPRSEPAPPALAVLRRLGVRRHTALLPAERAGTALALNGSSLDLADRHPQVAPSFTFFPEADAPAYVTAALDLGGRCAAVDPLAGRFELTDGHLEPVWPLLAEAHVPLVVRVGGGDGGRPLRDLLRRHPDLLVVAAPDGPAARHLLALLEEVDGVYLETAAVVRPGGGPAPSMRPRLAPKLVLGSRSPAGAVTPDGYAAHVAALVALGLSDDELRVVLWDAGRRLLGPPRG